MGTHGDDSPPDAGAAVPIAAVAVARAVAPLDSRRGSRSAPPVAPRPQQLASQLQQTVTSLAQRLQYAVTRVGLPGQVGLGAIATALVVALSMLLPAQRAVENLRTDLTRTLRAPPGTADAPGSAPAFLEKLPTRVGMPGVVAQIYQQAKDAGVALDTGRYSYSAAKAGGVARYELDFPVKAGYPNLRSFIGATLAAVPAAGLERLHIERKAVGDNVVSAEVRFVVFVRDE